MDLRRCPKCEKTKPITAYWRDKSRPNGRVSRCSDCMMEAQKERVRKFGSSEATRRWQKNNAVKEKARLTAFSAQAKGTLKKGPCFLCGKTDKIDGHHINYQYALKVIWLCKTHHREFHTTWKEVK